MLKINILNIKELETQELGRLFQLARIDIGQAISYMEGQRFAHENTMRDLTMIVDHGDQWHREPAKAQRLAELEMSNAYYSVIEKLKPLDIRPKTFHRFTKKNIRAMVDEIKEDIGNEVPQMKRAIETDADYAYMDKL